MKIYKYPLNLFPTMDGAAAEVQNVPSYSKILKVAKQRGQWCLWVLLDPEKTSTESKVILLVPTGADIPSAEGYALRYIDTVFDGPFVWHLFERCEIYL